MNESQLLSRFLQSGESIAVGGDIRDGIVIERLENQAHATTQTLLDQFFNDLGKGAELPRPDIIIPIFLLGKLLQTIPLRKNHPLRDLQDTVSECIEELNLEQIQKELSATEARPTNAELVSSVLRTIRALIDKM